MNPLCEVEVMRFLGADAPTRHHSDVWTAGRYCDAGAHYAIGPGAMDAQRPPAAPAAATCVPPRPGACTTRISANTPAAVRN